MFGGRVLTGLALRELSAPQTPKLDLRGPHAAEREGRKGDGVREGEEMEGRDSERMDRSDFGGQGDHGPLRCQTLSCSCVYPNSAERKCSGPILIHLH